MGPAGPPSGEAEKLMMQMGPGWAFELENLRCKWAPAGPVMRKASYADGPFGDRHAEKPLMLNNGLSKYIHYMHAAGVGDNVRL